MKLGQKGTASSYVMASVPLTLFAMLFGGKFWAFIFFFGCIGMACYSYYKYLVYSKQIISYKEKKELVKCAEGYEEFLKDYNLIPGEDENYTAADKVALSELRTYCRKCVDAKMKEKNVDRETAIEMLASSVEKGRQDENGKWYLVFPSSKKPEVIFKLYMD